MPTRVRSDLSPTAPETGGLSGADPGIWTFPSPINDSAICWTGVLPKRSTSSGALRISSQYDCARGIFLSHLHAFRLSRWSDLSPFVQPLPSASAQHPEPRYSRFHKKSNFCLRVSILLHYPLYFSVVASTSSKHSIRYGTDMITHLKKF